MTRELAMRHSQFLLRWKDYLEVYSRAFSAFQRYVGSYGKRYEVISQACRRQCQIHIWRVRNILVPDWGMPQLRPLMSVPPNDDGMECLTPGHFLIGHLIQSLPDSLSCTSLLRKVGAGVSGHGGVSRHFGDFHFMSPRRKLAWSCF